MSAKVLALVAPDWLDLDQEPCQGFASGCVCPRCTERESAGETLIQEQQTHCTCDHPIPDVEDICVKCGYEVGVSAPLRRAA